MNNGDNKFDFDSIAIFNKFLDEIDASEGPACLITIGTGKKRFSTGFSFELWS